MPKRYIIALIIVAVLFFGGIWLLLSLVTNRGSDEPAAEEPKTTQQTKNFTQDTNQVIYTTYGPVVAEENRRAIRISISASERKVEILNGYFETVASQQSLSNNEPAFKALLQALSGAQFESVDTKNKVDEFSVCSTGQRFVYEAKYSGDQSLRSWSNSCLRNQGSFRGNPSLVLTLFEAQIPDYSNFVSNVQL